MLLLLSASFATDVVDVGNSYLSGSFATATATATAVVVVVC